MKQGWGMYGLPGPSKATAGETRSSYSRLIFKLIALYGPQMML